MVNCYKWLLGGLAIGTVVTSATAVVDALKHDVIILNAKNFAQNVRRPGHNLPAAVLFYTDRAKARDFVTVTLDPLAKQIRGLVKVGAVDCTAQRQLCKDENVENLDKDPGFLRFYPPAPIPPFEYEGAKEVAKMSAKLLRLIPDARVQELNTTEEMSAFFGYAPAIPKVLLITNKSNISPLYKALAHTFGDRMNFGIVYNATQKAAITKKFKAKSYPALFLKVKDVSLSMKGTERYDGEMNFAAIHEWLNVHSETFVKGGGFTTNERPEPEDLRATKPWLFEEIPQMTKASHNDVCFKKPKGLCAVYLANELDPDMKDALLQLKESYADRPRTPDFHWSWMNVTAETAFRKLFKLGDTNTASFVIFNPHRKLRFAQLDLSITADRKSIAEFADKIILGDGRFTVLKNNKLPQFVTSKSIKGEREASGEL